MSISRRESLSIIAGASVASLVSPSLIYADEVAGANSKVVATEEMAGLISREIGEIRAQAKGLGLSNVDFDNLSIANGVPTYIFGGEVFHEEAPYFPITDNGKLVFWVIEDEHGVQIADGLVSELRGGCPVGSQRRHHLRPDHRLPLSGRRILVHAAGYISSISRKGRRRHDDCPEHIALLFDPLGPNSVISHSEGEQLQSLGSHRSPAVRVEHVLGRQTFAESLYDKAPS